MVDYHINLVNILNPILPTYYETNLTNDVELPCITYAERNNYAEADGDTLGYSLVSYNIKIWGKSILEIQDNAQKVDEILRSTGFKRTSSTETFDINSLVKYKMLVYEALFYEDFEEK